MVLRASLASIPLASLLVLLLLAGCGGAQPIKTTPATLRVRVVPETAVVYVDERFVGAGRVLARQPAVLTPGKHLVTIEAPGHFPHDLEVTLVPGVTQVEVALRPVPP